MYVVMLSWCVTALFFFCKQKTAYEMRISDWSSDVCSSDLKGRPNRNRTQVADHGDMVRARCFCPAVRAVCTAAAMIDNQTQSAMTVPPAAVYQIGRASCRARVCQYV